MARKEHEAHDTLEELASLGDRLAHWVTDHATLVLSVGAAVLIAAAAAGGYRSYSASQAREASAALSALRAEFVAAMGGSPGAIEIPEPANPETARNVRIEFAGRYLETAREHEGTAAAALARLEAGALLERAGEAVSALEAWESGLRHGPPDALRGALLTRIAVAHESAGRFQEAAEAHEQAAQIDDFPLAALARARAAWCWAEAGDSGRAVELYRIVQQETPELEIPVHIQSRLQEAELRAAP